MANIVNAIVKPSKIAGNGLFATKHIEPGDTILSVTRPAIAALDVPRLKDTCANCFAWTTQSAIGAREDSTATVKACTGCRTLHYCSKTCQSQSWKREHKLECKLFAETQSKGTLPNAARAVLSLLKRREHGLIPEPQWQNIMRLESHVQHIKAQGHQGRETFEVLSYGISQIAGTEKTGLSLFAVERCLGIMMTNALTLVTATFDPTGICIDPLACSANHSCGPNAVVVFDGPRLSFRSLKIIEEDQEVFIAYIDISDPYARRQQTLQSRYHFICECPKCNKGPTLREDRFEEPSRALSNPTPLDAAEERAWKLLEEGKKSENAVDAIRILSLAKESLESTRRWPLVRQPSPSIRQQLFVRQLSTEFSKIQALHSGFSIYFQIDPSLFPETFHPVRVVHNFTLAMLVLYLSGEQEDKQILKLQETGIDFGIVLYGLLQEVLSNVPKSHGIDSRFAKMVRQRCQEVFTDMTRRTATKLGEAEGRLEEQWMIVRQVFT